MKKNEFIIQYYSDSECQILTETVELKYLNEVSSRSTHRPIDKLVQFWCPGEEITDFKYYITYILAVVILGLCVLFWFFWCKNLNRSRQMVQEEMERRRNPQVVQPAHNNRRVQPVQYGVQPARYGVQPVQYSNAPNNPNVQVIYVPQV